LVDAFVPAQQTQGFDQGVVVVQIGVEQLEQPGIGGSVERRASSVGRVETRAGRCGVLPVLSLVMSMMSSLSWNTIPIASPKPPVAAARRARQRCSNRTAPRSQ
jgi:hypothetical protein